MQHHPYEIEINAAYARARVVEMAGEARRAPSATPNGRVAAAPPRWAPLRHGLGRRLIVLGERLAGPSVCPPAGARTAA